MQKRTIITLCLTILLFQVVFSQNINKEKLDSLFDAISINNKGMGSIAVSKNGNILYSRAIGYASISDNEKIPSTIKTIYRIGSITKMFTATMILQLVEDGKIWLDDKLSKFFPDLPGHDKITISFLLHHRSGLHNFTDDKDYLEWNEKPKTQKEMLTIIGKKPLDFEPDSKFSYSNSNFVVLGFILEKICKKPYAQVLKERITSKIGLTSTYFGGKTDVSKNESHSYSYGDSKWQQEPETDMSIPHGAGAIVSTPTELTKFIEALFAGKLINNNSLNKMKTLVDGYGMGITSFPFGKRKAFGHTGGIDGFGSILGYFPDDSLAVAYCSNGTVMSWNDIMIGVLSIYFGKPYTIPTFKSIAIKVEDLDKYLGVYSSSEMPLKITITKDKTTLIAQATGQSSFPLDATDKDIFRFDPAQIELRFNPDKNLMTLKQGGGTFEFTKDQ
jgi:CubicO group peptidase (beta-lactamase class C family)